MRTPRSLCGFLVVALLAGSLAARAQNAPSYRPPAASSQSAASSSGSAKCGGGAPAGASTVKQGNGNVPAPKSGQPAYAQVPLSLANYAVGGQLTIQLTVGSGSSPATFELFPAGTTFLANGTPSAQPVATQPNVAPGSCAALTYNFSRAGGYILAVTGTGGSNTFQYSAYVLPSFTGVFAAPPATAQSSQPMPAPPAPAPSAPPQPSSMFDGVFSPPPASPSPAPSSPSSPSPAPEQPSSPSSEGAPVMIQSVSIRNSPGLPDTGGHCIICGLVTGNLTAVEPNLVICVTPSGGKGTDRSCTGVCSPGHDCEARLQSQVTLSGSTDSVHVEVLDNDKDGKITPLAAFDESNPSQCTKEQPCKVDDSDDQGAGTLIGFEFGHGCDASSPGATSGSLWGSGPVLVASTAFPAGSLPAQAFRTGAQGCPAGHFTFTSCSTLISSEQLTQAFLSIYTGSDYFRSLMDNGIGKKGATVNVVVIGASCGAQWDYAAEAGKRAYAEYKANNPATALNAPVPDPTVFAYTEPSDRANEFDVVISDAFLAYGYYATWAPEKGLLGTGISELPIQLTLAYELGSNVVGYAADANFSENSYQVVTNCVMEQAFPEFVANGSNNNPVFDPNAKVYTAYATSSYVIPKKATTVMHPIVNRLPKNYFPSNSGQVTTYYLGSPGQTTAKVVTPLKGLSFAKAADESSAVKGVQKETKQVNEAGPTTCELSDGRVPSLAQLDTSGDDPKSFVQKSGIIKVDQDFSNLNSNPGGAGR